MNGELPKRQKNFIGVYFLAFRVRGYYNQQVDGCQIKVLHSSSFTYRPQKAWNPLFCWELLVKLSLTR